MVADHPHFDSRCIAPMISRRFYGWSGLEICRVPRGTITPDSGTDGGVPRKSYRPADRIHRFAIGASRYGTAVTYRLFQNPICRWCFGVAALPTRLHIGQTRSAKTKFRRNIQAHETTTTTTTTTTSQRRRRGIVCNPDAELTEILKHVAHGHRRGGGEGRESNRHRRGEQQIRRKPVKTRS